MSDKAAVVPDADMSEMPISYTVQQSERNESMTADAGCEIDSLDIEQDVSDSEAEQQAEEDRIAAERTARHAAEAAAREQRAQEAAETIGASAGFVTRLGVYYDASQGGTAVTASRSALVNPTENHVEEEHAEECSDDAGDTAFQDTFIDPVTFSRQVARLTASVARQPLQREIFYKVLAFCDEPHSLTDIEEYIASCASFKQAANSQYHFIQVLEQAGGLERFELDGDGEPVTPERKEGLTEDEIDDLVVSYAFMTTPVGMAVVDQHTPRARIIELLNLIPERKDTYIELLQFCAEEPRTYAEINELLHGRDALVRMVDGEPQTMQPSVFIDKLEAAAGIEWKGGWILTAEGQAYLSELQMLEI